MLNQESQDVLKSLGLTTDMLSEAISSEKEVSLDIKLPSSEGYTEEQFKELSKNRFQEGRDAQKQMIAKDYKEKFNLDIEGKDLDTVIEAQIAAKLKASGKADLQADLEALQGKIKTMEAEKVQAVQDSKLQTFNSGVDAKLLATIPDGTTIDKQDIIDLYRMKNTIVESDGKAVISINNEIQKDSVRNPVSAEDHFKAYLDKSSFIPSDAPNIDESKGGGTGGKQIFANSSEFMEYCKEEGTNPMSTEMQKLYRESRS